MRQRGHLQIENIWRGQIGTRRKLRRRDDHAHHAGVERGREKRVGPDRHAGHQSGYGAKRRAAPPDEGADEDRQHLRHAGEGQHADRGEQGLPRHPVMAIEVGEQQHDHDRQPPHLQDARAPFAGIRAGNLAAAKGGGDGAWGAGLAATARGAAAAE